MNISVARNDLVTALRQRGSTAYIVTVSHLGTPHVVQTQVSEQDGAVVLEVGPHTADNARTRPNVSVLFPSARAEDYSLIVDAIATVEPGTSGLRLLLAPTRAVLHRPIRVPDPPPSSCGSDCVPLSF